MPRSTYCRDPDAEIRETMFGLDCLARLSERTGITEPTLGRRKKNPWDLRLGEARALIKEKKIPPERIISILYE